MQKIGKDIYMAQAKIMLQHGSDNDYIKLLTHLSDEDIDDFEKIWHKVIGSVIYE